MRGMKINYKKFEVLRNDDPINAAATGHYSAIESGMMVSSRGVTGCTGAFLITKQWYTGTTTTVISGVAIFNKRPIMCGN